MKKLILSKLHICDFKKINDLEIAENDSDRIIDSINCGIDSLSFEDYIKEMKHYQKSRAENNGNIKGNGIYLHK